MARSSNVICSFSAQLIPWISPPFGLADDTVGIDDLSRIDRRYRFQHAHRAPCVCDHTVILRPSVKCATAQDGPIDPWLR
jgi:hypothetical protein